MSYSRNNWKSSIRVCYCWATIRQQNGGGVSGNEPSPSAPLTNQNHVLVTGAQIILAVPQFSSRYRFSVFIIPVQEMTGLVVAAFKHLMLSASPG